MTVIQDIFSTLQVVDRLADDSTSPAYDSVGILGFQDDLLHSLWLPWFQWPGLVCLKSYSKDLHILPPCSGLFPHAILFLRRAPVIGHLLNLPGIKTVSSLNQLSPWLLYRF